MVYIPNTKKTLELKKNKENNKKEELIRKKNRQIMFANFQKENPAASLKDFILNT